MARPEAGEYAAEGLLMIRLIRSMRTQTAVYWAPFRVDEFGKQEYAAPAQMKCRWVDKAEFFNTKDGSQAVSSAFVYCDRIVKIDGVLWLGKLSDVPAEAKPAANGGLWKPLKVDDAWIIRQFNRTPILRATNNTDPDRTVMKAVL